MKTKNVLLLLSCFILTSHSLAQTIEDESVAWLQELIQIDTINPPGNESRAVDFYAAIFEAEGIEYETAESAPGRGNIWARLEGGDQPGLVVLARLAAVAALVPGGAGAQCDARARPGDVGALGAGSGGDRIGRLDRRGEPRR